MNSVKRRLRPSEIRQSVEETHAVITRLVSATVLANNNGDLTPQKTAFLKIPARVHICKCSC
jgi:hypothetical protein